MKTHYENLQVSKNASERVIRAAYKSLSQEWHPDKHPGDSARAERIMKIINEAYKVLSDPTLREAHDKWIDEQANHARKKYQNSEYDESRNSDRSTRNAPEHEQYSNSSSTKGSDYASEHERENRLREQTRDFSETIISDRYIDLHDGTVIDKSTGLQWMRCPLGHNWINGECIGHAKMFRFIEETEEYLSRTELDRILGGSDDLKGLLPARNAIESFNTLGGYAGHQDWAIPTVKQQRSLIRCYKSKPGLLQRRLYWMPGKEGCDVDCDRPTIDTLAFPSFKYENYDYGFLTSSTAILQKDREFFDSCWIVNLRHGFTMSMNKMHASGFILLVRNNKHK